jgi:glucose-6-phosphate 1-dehydrogenase
MAASAGCAFRVWLLLDVLDGNAALSIRGDEAEEAWRVLTPVLSAWSKDLVPLEEYPAGSDGPGPRQPEGTN